MNNGILLVVEAPRRHTPALQRAFDLAQRMRTPVHVLLEAFDPLIERAAEEPDFGPGEAAREQMLADGRAWVDALVARWKADGLRATGEALWAPSVYRTIVQRALELEPRFVVKDAARVTGLRRLLFSVLDWKLVRYCPAPLMLVHPGSQHLPERILAAVDLAPDDPVNARILREAEFLGERCRAAVHLAHAFTFPATQRSSLETLYQQIHDDDAEAFRAFAQRHGVKPSRRHFLTGIPPIELKRLAASLPADLMVLGSAQRSIFDRMFLGTTAAALVRDLTCDLLLVKPEGFAEEVACWLGLKDQAGAPAWTRRSTGMRANRR